MFIKTGNRDVSRFLLIGSKIIIHVIVEKQDSKT
jgi:hypothetical protein